MQLPNSDSVEVQYLSRLFDNTSECYKFFWFQAIITKVLEGETDITYEELIDEMIAEAWYMVTEYHLNLGPRDTLEDLVLYIQQISGLGIWHAWRNADTGSIRSKGRVSTDD